MATSKGYVLVARVTLVILSLLAKANILIDRTGQACLADFGLLTIISDPKNLLSSSSCTQGGTVRWMSPELLSPQRFGLKNSRPTKPSDCYALGMVVYETISGNLPFHKHADLTVITKVLEGERPPRGARFTESLWKMLEFCWASQPNDRPSIEYVLQCLEVVSILSETPSPGVEEEREDVEDWDSASTTSGTTTSERSATPSSRPSSPDRRSASPFSIEPGPSTVQSEYSAIPTPPSDYTSTSPSDGGWPQLWPGAFPNPHVPNGPYSTPLVAPGDVCNSPAAQQQAKWENTSPDEEGDPSPKRLRPSPSGGDYLNLSDINRARQNEGEKPGGSCARLESSPGQGSQNPGQPQQPPAAMFQQQSLISQPSTSQGLLAGATPSTPPSMDIPSLTLLQQPGMGDLGDLTWDIDNFSPSSFMQNPEDLSFERDFERWFNPGYVTSDMG